MKKMLKYLALLLLLLPIFAGGGNQVAAAENNDVTIFLHKLLFPNGETPEAIVNTGDILDTDSLLQEYRGLNGVTFEVYDMTAAFYELRADGATVEEAQTALSELPDDALGMAFAADTTRAIDGEDGVAAFTLPAQVDKQDAVYLFRESAAPELVVGRAKNIVAVLPIYNASEELLSTIHLYPKNESMEHIVPEFGKEVPGQAESYQFGDVLTYEIKTQIPLDISNYTKYHVSDASDEGLVYQAESLTVKVGEDSVMEHCNLEEGENGFTLKFENFAAMHAHAGKEMTLQYQMQLVDVKTETNTFKNVAKLSTNFEELTREVEVKTGGKRFVKVDLADTDMQLTGAKFQIRNAEDQYLSKTDVGYSWTTDAKDENLVVVESGDKGQFEINGLAFGEYFLEETVAPTGYELSTTPVGFTVAEGSYTAEDEGVLKVVNLKTPERPNLPDTSGPEPAKPVTPTTPSTTQTTRPLLPKTGEIKNSSFIWLGAILLAGVVIALWQKNKKQKGSEEE